MTPQVIEGVKLLTGLEKPYQNEKDYLGSHGNGVNHDASDGRPSSERLEDS